MTCTAILKLFVCLTAGFFLANGEYGKSLLFWFAFRRELEQRIPNVLFPLRRRPFVAKTASRMRNRHVPLRLE